MFNDEPHQFRVFFATDVLLNLMVETDFQQRKLKFGYRERSLEHSTRKQVIVT